MDEISSFRNLLLAVVQVSQVEIVVPTLDHNYDEIDCSQAYHHELQIVCNEVITQKLRIVHDRNGGEKKQGETGEQGPAQGVLMEKLFVSLFEDHLVPFLRVAMRAVLLSVTKADQCVTHQEAWSPQSAAKFFGRHGDSGWTGR